MDPLTAEDIVEGSEEIVHNLCKRPIKRVKTWNAFGGYHVTSVTCPNCSTDWSPGILGRMSEAQLAERFSRPSRVIATTGQTLVYDEDGKKRFLRTVPVSEAYRYERYKYDS